MIEPEVEKVLTAVPELSPRYIELVEAADDDPGAPAVFEELAVFVTEHLRSEAGAIDDALVDRVLWAVESAAQGPDAEELVSWSFLENLGEPELEELQGRMGRRTALLLEEIGDGDGAGSR